MGLSSIAKVALALVVAGCAGAPGAGETNDETADALSPSGAAVGAPASASSAAVAAVTTLSPLEDAYVDSAAPSTNFGSDALLRLDGSPTVRRAYLKFAVVIPTGQRVTSAVLTTHAHSPGAAGFAVHVASSAWSEKTLTYGTSPSPGAVVIAASDPVDTGAVTALDVTPSLPKASGAVTFVLSTAGATAFSLASREDPGGHPPTLVVTTSPVADPILLGAGDIACSPNDAFYFGGSGDATHCRQKAVSDMMIARHPDAVFALGDEQYDNGLLSAFQVAYAESWGRLKSITRPAVGNHEYQNIVPNHANGYRAYFGSAATSSGGNLYYSYDIGAWHVVVLDSNCAELPGGCSKTSAQVRWLEADLTSNTKACVLSYWHHARFSDMGHGDHGPGSTDLPGGDVSAFWETLYAHHADLALNGHDHGYERFGLANPSGDPDPAGIRQIIAGKGGKNEAASFPSDPALLRHPAISQVREVDHFGALRLVLHASSYRGDFLSDRGVVVDSFTGTCH